LNSDDETKVTNLQPVGMSFSKEQSLFVVKVLDFLIEKKTEEIDANLDSDDLLSAIERWNR